MKEVNCIWDMYFTASNRAKVLSSTKTGIYMLAVLKTMR
jgi:hypothetical protein